MEFYKTYCINGSINALKRIYKKYNTDNLSYDYVNTVFVEACLHNQYYIVKYLLKKEKKIVLTAYDCYAFKWSCFYGYDKIVDLLLNVKNNEINITDDDHFAFKYACVNHHLKTALLLSNKYPYYYVHMAYDLNLKRTVILDWVIKDIYNDIYNNINDLYYLDYYNVYVSYKKKVNCILCKKEVNNVIKLCSSKKQHYYCFDCIDLIEEFKQCHICKKYNKIQLIKKLGA